MFLKEVNGELDFDKSFVKGCQISQLARYQK